MNSSATLIDLLPNSLKSDPFTVALAGAFEREIKGAYQEAQVLGNLNNVDRLPEAMLDFLAVQKHVDFYTNDLPIELKRELIKTSPALHRIKGTPAAVEQLITTLFEYGRVEEWYEYGGEPYHFRVITTNRSVNNERAAEFVRALDSVKNKRSRLDAVIVESAESMNIVYGAFVHEGDYTEVRQVW